MSDADTNVRIAREVMGWEEGAGDEDHPGCFHTPDGIAVTGCHEHELLRQWLPTTNPADALEAMQKMNRMFSMGWIPSQEGFAGEWEARIIDEAPVRQWDDPSFAMAACKAIIALLDEGVKPCSK